MSDAATSRAPGLILLGLLVLTSCRSTAPAAGGRGAGEAVRGSGPGATAEEAADSADAPWRLPAEAYPSQRLFRLQADSVEGGGSLRLVLRLEDPARYRLTISDRLGRTLYTVDATPDGGWLLDHRLRLACPLGPDLALGGVPLEAFDPAVLPRVLLGRVPADPAGRVISTGEGRLSFHDRLGRRWTVERRDGTVQGWVAWHGGQPTIWWRRIGAEALLSDRLRGVQMRWHQVAREPLTAPLPPAAVPPGYAAGACGPEAPEPDGSDGGRAEPE